MTETRAESKRQLRRKIDFRAPSHPEGSTRTRNGRRDCPTSRSALNCDSRLPS